MASTWPKRITGANRQIGESQVEVLMRAYRSPSGQIIIASSDNRLWCAAKRLKQRGLLDRFQFGTETTGYVTVYQITGRGRDKLKAHLAAQ